MTTRDAAQARIELAPIGEMLISRRRFLAIPIAAILTPAFLAVREGSSEPRPRSGTFALDIGLLYGALHFHLEGTVNEIADWIGGRYEVTIEGKGDGIANHIRARGIALDGRWAPQEWHSLFSVHGRETRSDIVYDWRQRTVDYHYREETFLLRRLRVADDRLPIPGPIVLDDAVSAALNYSEGRWRPEPDGSFQTHVVRRKRPANEHPDDTQRTYRAEVAPFVGRVTEDPASGVRTAVFDLSRFSSWARRDRPSQVRFAYDRRPDHIAMQMVLGTSINVQFQSNS